MQIGKLGLLLIAIIFIGLIVVALALAFPGFGAALHGFGVGTLGPAGMGLLSWIFQVPHIWGAESILYGATVTIATIVAWTIVWTLVLKRAWGKAKEKLHIGTTTQAPAPAAYPTMTQPQTVIVKEVPVPVKEETK